MSDNTNAVQENSSFEDNFLLDDEEPNLDEIEDKLDAELEVQFSDLELLEEEQAKISNPDSIGDTVLGVVWEQFINQVGTVAGQDFIEENRGLTLDLRKEAHIQTTENFAEGNIATHNTKIDYQQRYDDWQSNFEKDADGKVVMHNTRINERDDKGNVILGSDEKPVKKQVETLADGYRKPFDKVRNERGLVGNKEKGTAMDETVSVGEIVRDPAANAHMTKEEQIEFDLSEKNLNEIDAHWNSSKGDTPTNEWLDNPNSKGQKPQEIFDNMTDEDAEKLRQKNSEARAEYEKRKKEAEQRSIAAGKQSRKEEAFRIGGKALHAVLMGLLAELIKNIVQKLIAWIRAGEKNFKAFVAQIKDALLTFVKNFKQNVLTAGNTLATTIATAIVGPVVATVKKMWMLIKQGGKTIKDAILYLKKPENKEKPLSLKMLRVGEIAIGGLTAIGAIVSGELFQDALESIPVFAIPIPGLGNLANVLGIFLGAVVSGIIGALILRLIDKVIAKKQKQENLNRQIEKKNEILVTQGQLTDIKVEKLGQSKETTANAIVNRHRRAGEVISEALTTIYCDDEKDNEHCFDAIDRTLDSLLPEE